MHRTNHISTHLIISRKSNLDCQTCQQNFRLPTFSNSHWDILEAEFQTSRVSEFVHGGTAAHHQILHLTDHQGQWNERPGLRTPPKHRFSGDLVWSILTLIYCFTKEAISITQLFQYTVYNILKKNLNFWYDWNAVKCFLLIHLNEIIKQKYKAFHIIVVFYCIVKYLS